MVDALAAPNAREDSRLLIMPVCGNEDGDGFADGLVLRVTEEPFGAFVPANNDAVKVLGENRVVGGLNDGG